LLHHQRLVFRLQKEKRRNVKKVLLQKELNGVLGSVGFRSALLHLFHIGSNHNKVYG
jgi:hypothetical protein